ncbi:hepatic lectin-like isoform X1 [Channa argus]|uniref:hepatic lectin-like isoform X1 n=1 Tax=Channa argus TaxID=215402 RepID=UPI0035212F6E
MSSDIYTKPDFSKKVRCNRKVEEDGGEWEEREVDIYENTYDIRADGSDIQSQEEGPQTQNHPPVHRKSFRGAALCLAVLCLLMAAGIIVLSTYHVIVTSEKKQLEKKLNNLNNTCDKLCSQEWTRFGSSCYFKSSEKKTWSNSQTDCEKRESNLVIINSKEEQDFVTKLNMNEESWIGLKTKWTSGKYQWNWVDGSTQTKTFWATSPVDNPTVWTAAVCCDQQGQWTTQGYNHVRKWICEK